jgi:colanic acid biosynthesis protein WcaH
VLKNYKNLIDLGNYQMSNHNLRDILDRALMMIEHPQSGLPDAAFAFALRITPMINVDLFVRNEQGQTLLSWRDDTYGKGWHVPGGIIRLNEAAATRILIVAHDELGLSVDAESSPCHVHEHHTGYARGHFISLIYRCRPTSDFLRPELLGNVDDPKPGQISWFCVRPKNFYPQQKTYPEWLWEP